MSFPPGAGLFFFIFLKSVLKQNSRVCEKIFGRRKKQRYGSSGWEYFGRQGSQYHKIRGFRRPGEREIRIGTYLGNRQHLRQRRTRFFAGRAIGEGFGPLVGERPYQSLHQKSPASPGASRVPGTPARRSGAAPSGFSAAGSFPFPPGRTAASAALRRSGLRGQAQAIPLLLRGKDGGPKPQHGRQTGWTTETLNLKIPSRARSAGDLNFSLRRRSAALT